MFVALSVYMPMVLLFIWSYCGYLLVLTAFALFARRRTGNGTGTGSVSGQLPRIVMLVACHNEKNHIARKIRNCADLTYDGELSVYFVDGVSDDGTVDEIRAKIAGVGSMHLFEAGCTGKINQLNAALDPLRSKADIFVCSDTDALLERDVINRIAREFASEEKVWVVGAAIRPLTDMAIEQRYWQDQNLMRCLESRVSTSSIVVAPCYAFRSQLLQSFPADCIADDIHVAFLANTLGYRTTYLQSITGQETRTPSGMFEFMRHKFRKGNAFFIELLRFMYRLPDMHGWWKVIYLTKFLQIVVIPWLLPFFLLSTISFLVAGGLFLKIAVYALVLLFISLLTVSSTLGVYRTYHLPADSGRKGGVIMPFVLSNIVLFAVGLSFPFYRQSSCYARILSEPPAVPPRPELGR